MTPRAGRFIVGGKGRLTWVAAPQNQIVDGIEMGKNRLSRLSLVWLITAAGATIYAVIQILLCECLCRVIPGDAAA